MNQCSYCIAQSKGTPIIVEGHMMSKFFATRKVNGAYELTHVPSGFLVSKIKFPSLEEAEFFALFLESIDAKMWEVEIPKDVVVGLPDKLVELLTYLNNLSAVKPLLQATDISKIIDKWSRANA